MVSFCIFSFLSQQHTIFHTVFSLLASTFRLFRQFYIKYLLLRPVACFLPQLPPQHQSPGPSALFHLFRCWLRPWNLRVPQKGFLLRPSLRPLGHWLAGCVSGAPSSLPAAQMPPASLISQTQRSVGTAGTRSPRVIR